MIPATGSSSASRGPRPAIVCLALGAAAVVVLLAMRAAIVPVSGYREQQWAVRADGERGMLLRDERTRWTRVVNSGDATLARPGGVLVEWRAFLPVERTGTLGFVVESRGNASISVDGRPVVRVPGEEPTRDRGSIAVDPGVHGIRMEVEVPADRGMFRAVVRLPDGSTVPLDEAPVFVTAITPAGAAAAARFRAWADPALGAAAVLALLGLVGVLRAGTDRSLFAAELAGTALVAAVAFLVPHDPGLATWGTFLWGGTEGAARLAVLGMGLIPWIVARSGRVLRVPDQLPHPAAVGAATFGALWLLREGRFWGDAWTTIALLDGRADVGPFGPFFWKEPLDRLVAVAAVRMGAVAGIGTAASVALTSCLAGALAAGFATAHVRRFPEDARPAAFLFTAGAALVFFGHVENYAWASAAVIVFLLLVPRAAAGDADAVATGFAGGLAVAFHPVAAAVVVPALVALAAVRPRVAGRLAVAAAAVPVALFAGARAAGIDPPLIGVDRYADDPEVWLSPARAFAAPQLAAAANRTVALLSPGILLGLAAAIGRPGRPRRAFVPALAAAAGSAVFLLFLNGKIRPTAYDWDLWAPVAFPWALVAAQALVGPERHTARAWAYGVSAALLFSGVWGNRGG